jgi:predicted S18 family serine protease
MAFKAGAGNAYDAAQLQALIDETTAAVNAMDEKYEEIMPIIQQLKGEDVIGESETKTALLEVVDGFEKTFGKIKERLDKAKSNIDQVSAVLESSTAANKAATEEAGAQTAAAAKKADEIDGSGAN